MGVNTIIGHDQGQGTKTIEEVFFDLVETKNNIHTLNDYV